MQAKVNWKNGLSFEGTADSGFKVDLGAEAEVGGANDGFRPMELMVLSLAGCTAMDVISILQKKRQDVTDFEVHVDAQRATEHPKVITSALIEYVVSGHGVDEAALLRAIELSAERYCPAQSMLTQVFPLELNFQIFEDKEGKKDLVKQGQFMPG
jgi:putative redox protein